MKMLVSVIVALFVANTAFAAGAKGNKLEKAVLKMQTCVGVNSLDGYAISFFEGGYARIDSLTPSATETMSAYAAGLYEANGSYAGVYGKFNELAAEGGVRASINSTWSVKKSKVLVSLDNKSKAESLYIYLKSQACSVAF